MRYRVALLVLGFVLAVMLAANILLFMLFTGPMMRDVAMVFHFPIWVQWEMERVTHNSCEVQDWYWEWQYRRR